MTPTDPRHGTRAGYTAHRKAGQGACPACLRGRARADKAVRLDHHRATQLVYSAEEIAALLDPWLAQGFAYGAIANGARLGLTHGARLASRIADGQTFRRVTYQALARVTEDSFSGSSKVYADLTRTRIYSLRAAGHTLRSIPILETGQWRHREHITVDQARAVRDHYAVNEATLGGDRHTQSRALNDGHRPPLAWDDPGTLAWPLGWTQPIETAGLDQVVVERILAGDWRLRATALERREVVRRWLTSGRPVNELERLTGWQPQRYYDTTTRAAS